MTVSHLEKEDYLNYYRSATQQPDHGEQAIVQSATNQLLYIN